MAGNPGLLLSRGVDGSCNRNLTTCRAPTWTVVVLTLLLQICCCTRSGLASARETNQQLSHRFSYWNPFTGPSWGTLGARHLISTSPETTVTTETGTKTVPSVPLPPPVELNDLVVVIPSCSTRQALVEGSRPWRVGIRTLIVTNGTSEELMQLEQAHSGRLESYLFVADEDRSFTKKKPYSKRPGDYRAALAPFLAHQHYNERYKWMLYGDDDTLFFLPGVSRVLWSLNPEDPIALTDNLWMQYKQHP